MQIVVLLFGICKIEKVMYLDAYIKHGKRACTSHTIKEEQLKAIIMDDLRRLTEAGIDKNSLFDKIEKTIQKNRIEKQKKLVQKEREVEKLKNENRKFLKLLANEVITQDEYRDITSLNQGKINTLGLEILNLKSGCNEETEDSKQLDKLFSIARAF